MSTRGDNRPQDPGRRRHVYDIIFNADAPAERRFDIVLLVTIALSVVVVMLSSVAAIPARYGRWLIVADWVFTLVFTAEYAVRLWCVRKPLRYALSFYGIVDLLGVIPTYLGLVLAGGRFLSTIRFLRMLRVFRVLHLPSYQREIHTWVMAFKAARKRLTVFLFVVATIVVVLGSLMYVVETAASGFTSIPMSIYWAIVTLTTVGYGDISPASPLGRAIAALIMILGYSIIVVPTGIISVELSRLDASEGGTSDPAPCPACSHKPEAGSRFCSRCGTELSPRP